MKKQYFTYNMVSLIVYFTFLIFMLILNGMLLIPAILKPFTVQTYAFFTFKTLIGLEIIAIFAAIFGRFKLFANWLSVFNMFVLFISGLAFPYLIISGLRLAVIVFQAIEIREVYYNILNEYTEISLDINQEQQNYKEENGDN